MGGNVASRGPAVSEIGNGESANATDSRNAEPIDLDRLNEQDIGASATPDAVPRSQSLWGDVAISAEVGGRSWLDAKAAGAAAEDTREDATLCADADRSAGANESRPSTRNGVA